MQAHTGTELVAKLSGQTASQPEDWKRNLPQPWRAGGRREMFVYSHMLLRE